MIRSVCLAPLESDNSRCVHLLDAFRAREALLAQVVEVAGAMGSIGFVLRANALYLVAASTLAFLMGALGVPVAGVGFVDAHELALVSGLLLWSASPRRCWHLAAAAVQALFAAANLAHWQTFVTADIVPAGCLTTSMHLLFAVLQCLAARTATASLRPLAAAADAAW